MYINTFKYSPQDVSCKLCTEYVKKVGCTVFTRAAIGRTATLIWIWRTWLPSLPPCANPTTTTPSLSMSCKSGKE